MEEKTTNDVERYWLRLGRSARLLQEGLLNGALKWSDSGSVY